MKTQAWLRLTCALAFVGWVGQADASQAPAGPKALPPLVPEITRAELQAHVEYLASDELRGRFTGTPEAVRAADYLARVLAACHIEPGGDAGSFLQRVPLERRRTTRAAELLVTPTQGEPFHAEYGVDFELQASVERVTPALRLLSVRLAEDLPAKPDPSVALFIDGSLSERRRLFPRRDDPSAQGWGLKLARGSVAPGAPRPIGEGSWSPAAAPGRQPDLWISLNGRLLERAQKGEIAMVQLTTHVEREALDAYNVVGMLAGEGSPALPALRDEVIVLSAHYDHLHEIAAGPSGSAAPASELDRIYNGADDDASGCAAVLEIAGRFGAGPRPLRTLVFLLATGEEIGLIGTKHYLDHPTRPLDKTVLNLNFEMIGRPDPKAGGAGKLWLTGYELSNLGAAFAAADLEIVADPHPEEHFFERSDNIAFVQRGIVGQTLSSYGLHKDYHAVSDEAETLDFAHLLAGARAGNDAVALVAGGALRPAWLEGKDPNVRGSRPSRRDEPK